MKEYGYLMPLYNGMKWLPGFALSCASSGIGNACVVFDDGSTDGGGEFMESRGYKVLRSESRKGIVAGFDSIFKYAIDGNYKAIRILCHDTYPVESTGEFEWLALEKGGFWVGDLIKRDVRTNTDEHYWSKVLPVGGKYRITREIFDMAVEHGNTLGGLPNWSIPREVFSKLKFRADIRRGEIIYLMQAFALMGEMFLFNEPVVIDYIDGGNIRKTYRQSIPEILEEENLVRSEYKKIFREGRVN